MNHVMRWKIWLAGILLVLPLSALSIGILVPRQPYPQPISLINQHIAVEINERVAVTQIEQVFYNHSPRQREATYVFPVPKGAQITDFLLYINGKPVKGEILEKDKARRIYEDIVRQMRDPALLEFLEHRLFRVRIFPIPAHGKQRLAIQYTQLLEGQDDLLHYFLPLHLTESAVKNVEDLKEVSLTIRISARQPIKSVYSPDYKLEADHRGEKEAEIWVTAAELETMKDFHLYVSYSEKPYGLNVLTFKDDGDEDGYFLLLLTPEWKIDEKDVVPKTITFVLDTSGSMAEDNKLKDAKRALLYCLSNLNKKDKFNIIRFSTEVETLADQPLDAEADNIDKAKKFVEKLTPRGGTNIHQALLRALEMKGSNELYVIVFLTDGLPTVGITDVEEIVKNVTAQNKDNIRVFTFGLGYNVNTHLLDKIGEKTRAASEYVSPGEELELKITGFFDKVNSPVMTDIKLDLGQLKAYDIYSPELPDMFAGSQLTLLGRYRNSCSTAITLKGKLGGKDLKHVFEATFPAKELNNEFITSLWAARKIGYLLDEIRLHGEEKELKDEVIALSKEFGIPTPYTSYLVQEDKEYYREAGVRHVPAAIRRQVEQRHLALKSEAFESQVGRDAVVASQAVSELKEKAYAPVQSVRIKRIGEKVFEWKDGFWSDRAIRSDMPVINIKYLSDAYFQLVKINPAIKKYLTLGEMIKVVINDILVTISDTGQETLSPHDQTRLKSNQLP